MKAILGLLLIIALSSSVTAQSLRAPMNAAALRALGRARANAVIELTKPVAVAGIRGAQVRPDELYWKGGDVSAEVMLAEAEKLETAEQFEEAAKRYRKALLLLSGGRSADRAAIGLSTSQIRLGEIDLAIRRLRGVLARSNDPGVKFAAAIPLAIALDSRGEKTEALGILKKLASLHPDHALSGQADATILFLSE